MLQELDRDLWIVEQPLRFLGLEVGARMTVLRLHDDRLVLHSPIQYSPELGGAIEKLGSVDWVVAPNRLHHLYVSEWYDVFPRSVMLMAPGLADKRPDLSDAETLSSKASEEWAGVLDALPINGFPLANEYVFFHRPSATLIISDLAFNFGEDCPTMTRLIIRLSGGLGRLAPTPMERLLIRDRAAFRASLKALFEWPFDRVIVAHGDVVESNGREALMQGYEWLLGHS